MKLKENTRIVLYTDSFLSLDAIFRVCFSVLIRILHSILNENLNVLWQRQPKFADRLNYTILHSDWQLLRGFHILHRFSGNYLLSDCIFKSHYKQTVFGRSRFCLKLLCISFVAQKMAISLSVKQNTIAIIGWIVQCICMNPFFFIRCM